MGILGIIVLTVLLAAGGIFAWRFVRRERRDRP